MVPAAKRQDSAHKRAYVVVLASGCEKGGHSTGHLYAVMRGQREAGLENLLSISKSGYSPTCDKRIGA
jgi:hypothetical protein